jgi:peptide/nickel transport system substrate-binding protein
VRGTALPRTTALLIVPLTLVLGAAAGCAGSSSTQKAGDSQPAPSGTVGNTLTIGQSIGATTLDPDKTVQADAYFEQLAYEPLIVRQSDGNLAPGLALSWNFAGTGNMKFVMQLRPGVTFSDGTTLTAQNVVDDFAYLEKSAGQEAPTFAGDTFTATGPLQVTVTMKTPDPDLPTELTQDDNAGDIISETGLKSPAQLGTQTFGAGPYEIAPAQTVAGDHYTYVPNPDYYDKSAVHWKKVVIKVIADASSMLSAMQTGEVNLAQGDPSTLAAAKTAGLTVTSTPLLWVGITLADRDGKVARPLASLAVRQALNDATDRTAIINALFPGNGSPTDQVTVPGGYGYQASLDNSYPFDLAKAKSLLAAAGYPNGFTIGMVSGDFGGQNLLAQALQQQWAKIGVTVKITDIANTNQFFAASFSGKYPAFTTVYGQQPIVTEGPGLFLPAALFNPFHTTASALQTMYNQDAASSGQAKAALDQQIEAYLVHQAWFVPVLTQGLPFYATKNITGSNVSPMAPLVELYQIQPAG